MLNRFNSLAIAAISALLALGACGTNEEVVNPEDRLCPGESGVGMRVIGRAQPLDMCVSNDDVGAIFTSQGRYDVVARIQTDDGAFEVHLVFGHHEDFPLTLNLTGNLAEAMGDPLGAWLYYQEVPGSGDPIQSTAVTGGTFSLTFSDQTTVVATLAGVSMTMENQSTQEDAGTRGIPEGFLSITAAPAIN